MAPVDPTYPLHPIACALAATLLLIMLITSMVKHSWNLGVPFLSFWLFWELLSLAVNAIVWSDNVDIKAYVYCDIDGLIRLVSHLQVFVGVAKPACTLIITRRLYRVASSRSVEPSSRREKIWGHTVDWSIGVGLPVLVTGVFCASLFHSRHAKLYIELSSDYIDQNSRFKVLEGSGCTNSLAGSGIDLLIIFSWPVILPLASALFYCPKIIYVFYRHSREMNEFLQSDSSTSQNKYMHILVLGCLDIVFTLPFGIINLVLFQQTQMPGQPVVFYYGWAAIHADWEPVQLSYDKIVGSSTGGVCLFYVQQWASPLLGIALFLLLGLTPEARATYWRGIVATGKPFGWKFPNQNHESKVLTQIQFERDIITVSDPQSLAEQGLEISIAVEKLDAHGEANAIVRARDLRIIQVAR